MEAINNLLKRHKAGRMLEVGTGSGKFIPTILNIFHGIDEIIGIDMDAELIRQATVNYSANKKLKFTVMNAEELEFEDNFFDTVYISNALHHIPSETKVLEEMKRVLKSEGIFFINELICDDQNEAQMSHIMYHHFNADIDQRLGIYHHYTYTKQDVMDIIKRNGVKIEYLYEYNESKEDVRSKQDIRLVSQACRKHMERTKEFIDHLKYKRRGEDIIDRLNRVGIQRPTQIMIVGRID